MSAEGGEGEGCGRGVGVVQATDLGPLRGREDCLREPRVAQAVGREMVMPGVRWRRVVVVVEGGMVWV